MWRVGSNGTPTGLAQLTSDQTVNGQVMQQSQYECLNCGAQLSYKTTKHNGCANCGYLPAHSAD